MGRKMKMRPIISEHTEPKSWVKLCFTASAGGSVTSAHDPSLPHMSKGQRQLRIPGPYSPLQGQQPRSRGKFKEQTFRPGEINKYDNMCEDQGSFPVLPQLSRNRVNLRRCVVMA